MSYKNYRAACKSTDDPPAGRIAIFTPARSGISFD